MRQGCPLSSIIFALLMELLTTAIRKNGDISGIQVGTVEHKIGLYADNVLLVLSNLLQSLSDVFHTIQEFCKLSLYKVDARKSQILGIKHPSNSPDPYF